MHLLNIAATADHISYTSLPWYTSDRSFTAVELQPGLVPSGDCVFGIDMVSRLVKLVSIDVALITMMMPVSAWPIIPYLPGSSINVSFAGWHIDTRR
ncbi:predicted protein [Botrytis cinerea T4]|uniref:Uncharacterized protein n=1 Tax=Botryotinia fuckeliana (strain T4) TaxID=999810 RepID=G2Y1S9_BOTF4|nr:predicted protein [Botrytis cinerea T4]